jgi:hypothetical protein
MSNTDSWVKANSAPLDHKKVHALGLITLRWNRCEYGLFLLFAEVVKLPIKECWILVHNLGDLAIVERIKAMMTERKYDAETIAQITNALEHYKICNENRNSLTHSWTKRVAGEMVLARQSKSIANMNPYPIPSSLADLRRVAEDLDTLSHRLFYLEAILSESDPKQPLPWRERLSPPDRLWSQAPQVPTKRKRQRKSSRK